MQPSEFSGDIVQLVRRCQRSDSRAWSTLVSQYQSLVYSVPRRYGLNEDDAADVFLLTFQALFRTLDRFESPEGLPKWLAVTAARESLRLVRANSKSVSLPLDELLANEELSIERDAIVADSAYRLRAAVGSLPDRCRKLLTALYLEERSYAEITEELGLPTGAIGPTRARCLDKLRQVLSKDGFFD